MTFQIYLEGFAFAISNYTSEYQYVCIKCNFAVFDSCLTLISVQKLMRRQRRETRSERTDTETDREIGTSVELHLIDGT